MRAKSMADVYTWFREIFTEAADMTVVVEGEDISGKVENRVPKAVKVKVSEAELSKEFAAAWTPGDPRTWKTANDFMNYSEYHFQACRKDVGLRGKKEQCWRSIEDR